MLCTPSPPLKKKHVFSHTPCQSFREKKDVLVHAVLEDLKLLSHVPVYLIQEENVRHCWLGLPQIYPRTGLTGSDIVPSRMPCTLNMCAGEDSRFGGWVVGHFLRGALSLLLWAELQTKAHFSFRFDSLFPFRD